MIKMITKEFKISVKNQVTLPKKVLDELNIGPGDPIFFEIKNHHVEVCPAKQNKISALDLGKEFRHLPKKKTTIEQINQAIQEGYTELAHKNK